MRINLTKNVKSFNRRCKKIGRSGNKKPRSIYMAAMLVARGEPYCTMIDLSLFASAMEELLDENSG